MRKVLLDECVDWRLLRSLGQFEVSTARQMGWSHLKNGKLLREAATKFEVLVSTDQGIEHQNNLNEIGIAIVVLMPKRNKLSEIVPMLPEILVALTEVQIGSARYVPEN